MKCDELKVYHCNEWHNEYTEFNLKSDVDAAIDELKAAHHKERHEYIKMIAELNAEINRKEDVGKRWFKRCMEARAENVKLKRALWIARAEIAHKKIDEYWPDYCHNAHSRIALLKWEEVERKCRAKAEEYK